MMEILSVVNLVPAVVNYRERGFDKSVIVFIDYANQNIIPTEDIEDGCRTPLGEFRKAVFAHIQKSRKPSVVPEVPKGGFDLDARMQFNNSD